MKLTIPYSFVSIADPYWFLADLYTVRDFYNGRIDDYNVKEFNITTAKIKDGEIKGHHFEDLAATNAKFKSVGHNPATADKIQQASIGPFDMRADAGPESLNNVKGLWTPTDNMKKVKVWTGATDEITLYNSVYYKITDTLYWSDLLPDFSGFLINEAGVVPDILIFATIEAVTGFADFEHYIEITPFAIDISSVRFFLNTLSTTTFPYSTVRILLEVWDIGD